MQRMTVALPLITFYQIRGNISRRIISLRSLRSRVDCVRSYILIQLLVASERSTEVFVGQETRGVYERLRMSGKIVEANRHGQNIRCSLQLQFRVSE